MKIDGRVKIVDSNNVKYFSVTLERILTKWEIDLEERERSRGNGKVAGLESEVTRRTSEI